jgi:hypothetical protein
MYNQDVKKLIHDTHVQQQSERKCSGPLLVKKILPKSVKI